MDGFVVNLEVPGLSFGRGPGNSGGKNLLKIGRSVSLYFLDELLNTEVRSLGVNEFGTGPNRQIDPNSPIMIYWNHQADSFHG